VYLFELPVHIPNFVTNNSVSAPICFLNSPEDFRDNSIMVIERADPGYDWIFTRNIKGIITCYGGANSHMAVRAKELNLPAAIGVGEEMFEKYSNCSTLFLDCRNRIIEVIQ
jgi:phosphoenolpyruvate-protein kinase (PTS system EI component)